MDGASNGLGKLIPRSITSKRRRTKASSIASSNEDGASPRGGRSLASQGTTESDRTSNRDSFRNDDDNDNDRENHDVVSYDSDPES